MTHNPIILPRRPRALQALICCLLLFTAACETPGLRDDPAKLEDRAISQQEAGNYRAAAQIYERLVNRIDASQRDEFRLKAAEAWYLSGDRSRAMQNMRSVRRPFPAGLGPALQLMAAAIEVETNASQAALQRLRRLPAELPRDIASDALAVGARAWFTLKRPDRAVETLMEREVWLDNPGEIMANQQLIWEGLRSYGEIDIPDTADPVLAGWLDLANAVADTAGDPFAQRAGLLRWRSAWPTHPARDVLLPALLGGASELRVPQRVALLLPQTGRLESSGAALRDGFIAAYFDYGDAVEGMEIMVYDTADLGATNAYRMAVENGADFVVGPLIKSEVAEVATLAPAGPATLALNYLPAQTPAPPNFFQFALAPEHEAQRVAQRAIGEGLYNAVALVPDNDWGQRLLDAFGQELQTLGGKLLAHDLYQPDASDFSSVIRPILHLDRSRSRRRALESVVGQSLEFEPRRRQDIDFIFVAAQPRQARAIKPQLRFHYASSLPVFATAAAFSPDADLNRDIDGLIFASTPWEVSPDEDTARMRSTIDRYWPTRAQHRSALYAMGYDAWRLVPLLGGTSKEPMALRGMTGELSLQSDGRVIRNPALARIEDGVPTALEQLEDTSDTPGLDDESESETDSPVLPGGSGSP